MSFDLVNVVVFTIYDDKDIEKVYNTLNIGNLTEDDALIDFDFVNKKINMKSYSIRTSYSAINAYHPKSWQFVGSNDHEKWDLIDMKENNNELNGPRNISHFECSNKNGFYRYIKFIQTENWNNLSYYTNIGYYGMYKYYIGLSSIEFFGSIETQ